MNPNPSWKEAPWECLRFRGSVDPQTEMCMAKPNCKAVAEVIWEAGQHRFAGDWTMIYVCKDHDNADAVAEAAQGGEDD